MQASGALKINDRLKVISYTKLMEHVDTLSSEIRPALKKASGGITELAVLSDEDGCDLVFANNPGQGMICYYFGEQISLMNGSFVPLYGEKMAAGVAADGTAYAFAVRENKIYVSMEKAPHSGDFSDEEPFVFSRPQFFEEITSISAVSMDQGFALFIVSKTTKDMAYITCHIIGQTYDYLLPVAFHPGRFCFSGKSESDLCIRQVYSTGGLFGTASFYGTCKVSDNDLTIYRLEFPNQALVSDLALCGEQAFCTDSASHFWQISVQGEHALLTDAGEAGAVKGICMQKSDGILHAAAVSPNKRLLHFKLSGSSEKYVSTPPFPIDLNVNAAAFSQYQNSITLYYYNSATASIVKLAYNPDGGNWNEMNFSVPEPGTVLRHSCYSTELTLLDAEKQTPLIEVPVDVWTEQRSYIETSEGLRLCDSKHKIRLETDKMGKIILVQYTDKIDAPILYASPPENLLDPDQCLTFRQYETVSGRMESVSADDILNAATTDSMGTGQGKLLPDQYRTKENAEALANTLHQVMALNGPVNRGPLCRGTYLIHKSEIGSLNRLSPAGAGPLPCWSLSVEGTRLKYRDFTDEEAEERILQIRSEGVLLTDAEFNGFFSAIGDFFRGVAKKIVDVVEVIVKGVKTVVKFVIDTVTMVYEFVAKVIGEILDFVETIFAAVLVFFVGLFAWLAALFQWDDVKRTERALCGAFDVLMDSFPAILERMEGQTIDFFKKYELDLDSKIDDICQSLLPGEPILPYINQNTPEQPEASETLSNDYLTDKLTHTDFSGCLLLTEEELAGCRAGLGDILDQWEQFAETLSETDDFKEVAHYFKEAFSSLDGLFENLMVSLLQLLKALLHMILKGFTALISATFDAFLSLLSMIRRILTKKIQIPFFTNLYRLMVGDDLTILNLLCFILSVPVVTLSKLISGKPPFADDTAVENFLSDCHKVFSMTNSRDLTYINEGGQFTVSVISATIGCLFNVISIIPDHEACTKIPDRSHPEPAGPMDYSVWVLELLWLGFSTPWWYETKEEPVEDSSIALWSYFILGVTVDGYFLFKGTHIDKSGWKGRMITTFYGFIHFCLILGITRDEKTPAENCIPDFCGGITEMLKLLIDINVDRDVNSWCKWPVMGADGITATVVFVCGIVDAATNFKEDNYGNKV